MRSLWDRSAVTTARQRGCLRSRNAKRHHHLAALGREGHSIQFLFPRSISREDRETVWSGLADLAEGARAVVSATRKKEETPSDSLVKPQEWWDYAAKSLEQMEASGQAVSAFG